MCLALTEALMSHFPRHVVNNIPYLFPSGHWRAQLQVHKKCAKQSMVPSEQSPATCNDPYQRPYLCSVININCSLSVLGEHSVRLFWGEKDLQYWTTCSNFEQFQRTELWRVRTACTTSLSLGLVKHRNQSPF